MARTDGKKACGGQRSPIESSPSTFFAFTHVFFSRDLSRQKTEYCAETDNSKGKKYEALYSVTRPRLSPCR
jgi:hypothetical protein